MTALFTIHVALLFVSACICMWLAYDVGIATRGRGTGGRFLYVLLAGLSWPLASALSIVSPGEELATWFLMLRYAAISCAAASILHFCLAYADQVRSRLRSVVVFAVPFLVSFAIVAAPGSFLSDVKFVHSGPFLLVESYEPHWVYWANTFYVYVLLGTSYCLIFAAMFRSRTLYTGQIFLLVAGATLLFGVNILTRADVFGLGMPHLDWAGGALGAACVLWHAAIFNYRFLDVMPVARDVLVETLPDGVLVVDTLGRVVDANAAMRAVLKEPRSAPLGEQLEKVLPPELLPHVTGPEGLEVSKEVRISLPNGARQFDLRVSRLSTRTGESIGRLVVLQDVTDRARMIRDLDAYTRVVAHDLKNPVGVIAGYTDLLRETAASLPDEERGYLEVISRTCGQMTTIINELLLMASLQGEKPQVEELDMAELVGEAQKRLSQAIAGSGAEIVVAETFPVAMGKAAWIEEVWVNYISNAIKYGGSPPRVEVGAAPSEDGMARFFVRDNGAGLSADQRSKLFAEFKRLVPEQIEGHGLGLSIVRRIVETLGGTAGAESAPGQGSTFWFTLPRT